MAFEDVPAQQAAVRALTELLEAERLPHALLFLGAEGTGRLDAARELARIVLCHGDSPTEACGRCPSCRMMADDHHADYREAGVPDGRQSVPIDAVREMQSVASLKPAAGTRRAFVIRDADRMSIEAANSFLKTLEEPPEPCVFVLLAASLQQVPETIVSRCRLVRFHNLPPGVLRDELESEGVPADAARWLARRCWGSPGLARRLHELGFYERHQRLADALKKLTKEDNFHLSDELSGFAYSHGGSGTESRNTLQDLLENVALFYRDLAAGAAGAEQDQLVDPALAGDLDALTEGHSPDDFLRCADLVMESIDRIGGNANVQITLDNLFTQLGMRRSTEKRA